jgi:hypothetical protein
MSIVVSSLVGLSTTFNLSVVEVDLCETLKALPETTTIGTDIMQTFLVSTTDPTDCSRCEGFPSEELKTTDQGLLTSNPTAFRYIVRTSDMGSQSGGSGLYDGVPFPLEWRLTSAVVNGTEYVVGTPPSLTVPNTGALSFRTDFNLSSPFLYLIPNNLMTFWNNAFEQLGLRDQFGLYAQLRAPVDGDLSFEFLTGQNVTTWSFTLDRYAGGVQDTNVPLTMAWNGVSGEWSIANPPFVFNPYTSQSTYTPLIYLPCWQEPDVGAQNEKFI